MLSTRPPASSGRSSKTKDSDTEVFKPSIVQDAESRSPRAREYEEKTKGILNLVMRALAGNETTVPDAAVFIEHGPAFASKAGDLAAHDRRVSKAIDFIATGTDNPYGALVVAALPILAQVIRNHESDSAKPFTIRIPFTKKTFTPKIKIKLNTPLIRAMTVHPMSLVKKVFGDPDLKKALIENGVDVALPEYQNVGSLNGKPAS